MENGVETKKHQLILSKYILHIAFLIIATFSFGQTVDPAKEATWKKESKKLKYKKAKDYNGPEDWASTKPSSIKDGERYTPLDYTPNSRPAPSRYGTSRGPRYSSRSIQQDRANRNGNESGGGRGTLKYDPKIKRPKDTKSQKFEDYTPDVDPQKSDSSGASSSFWQILLYGLLIIAIVVVLFYIFKQYRPPVKKVHVNVENEWNPEIITKTELQLKLEEAMAREDYRECVRIYFTFILKELISKGWIRWKKEKTNHHYVMEMGAKKMLCLSWNVFEFTTLFGTEITTSMKTFLKC